MRLLGSVVELAALLAIALAVSGCANGAAVAPITAARSIENGPAADYPLVIGEPFEVDGVTYTPEDTLNYDRVGYAGVDASAGKGVTGSHRTLPLPSYVEVTSLESGRTILVRIERRGPMTNERLLALSPDAMVQLGAGDGAPIRMRRVNPPEDHRAELRAGGQAPLRMDTPKGLLQVLRRRLPERGSIALGDARPHEIGGMTPPAEVSATAETPANLSSSAKTESTESPQATTQTTQPPVAEAAGKFVIQIGTFAVRSNADRLAEKVGGFSQPSGKFTLVRVGPYSTRGQAEEALAKLRSQGYSDAQIRILD